jgi:hypothetical protein
MIKERGVKQNVYVLYKLYNYYRSFIKGSVRKRKIVPSQTLYTAILFKVFQKIFKKMLCDAYKFSIKDIGEFFVIKYLPETKINEDGTILTNKVLNIQATVKACKETGNKKLRIYRDNEETNGFIYRVYWKKSNFVNKAFYWFSVYRNNKVVMRDTILAGEAVAIETNFKL